MDFAIKVYIAIILVLFIWDSLDLEDSEIVGYLGPENPKWTFGRNIQQFDEQMALSFKSNRGFYKLSGERFQDDIVTKLNSRKRGLLVFVFRRHDKLSLIRDFLCSSKTFEMYFICSKIVFYHMCTKDDDASRNLQHFITKLVESIISHFIEIGQSMYFDRKIIKYLYSDLCMKDPGLCIQKTIVKPLQTYSDMGNVNHKKRLIVLDFIDDCYQNGDDEKWNILTTIRLLIRIMPSIFKFLLTTRDQSYIFDDLERINIEVLFHRGHAWQLAGINVPLAGLSYGDPNDKIGYCNDCTEISVTLFCLCSLWYIKPTISLKFYLLTVIVCCIFIKFVVTFGVLLFAIALVCTSYIRYKLSRKSSWHVQKNWFYKMNFKCDEIDIHCIIDQRLELKYFNLKSLYERRTNLEHLVDPNLKTKSVQELECSSMSEFELLVYYYNIKSTECNGEQMNLRQALIQASQQKSAMLCRWLLTNIQHEVEGNREIETALHTSFIKNDKYTAKAISWCITKTFYRTYSAYVRTAIDIYPGLKCECKKKGIETNALCSRKKLIVVLSDTQINGLPRKYKGFSIKIVNKAKMPTTRSEAAHLTDILSKNNNDESFYLRVNISNLVAGKIFRRHKNLNLMHPSVYRSFSFQNDHEIQNELCIRLYVKQKGIIPIGENHFPDSIHGIPTDIIEGDVCFLSKLHIGDKIGTVTSAGTLGGFVQYLDFECFLTCAHVMYDMQTLLSSTSDFTRLTGAKAYIHTVQGIMECGKVMRRTFDHDNPHNTSVDAALVLLQNNANIDPNDYILDGGGNPCPFTRLGLSSKYLNSCCLDHEEFCVSHQTSTVVGAGAVTKVEKMVTFPKQTEVEIEFGAIGQSVANANATVFQPLWIHSPAHMQIATGQLTHKRVFCMYNQIIINLGLNPGDSGTCIYVVQNQTKNGCIGMAIAFCGGMTIVTPLKDILKRLSS